MAPNKLPASLKATAIIGDSKAALPAELMSLLLDYLPVPALLRFAQTSRRSREMVYDDSRWVRRLKALGVWNEAEAQARRRAESEARKSAGKRPESALFDVEAEQRRMRGVTGMGRGAVDPGFENVRPVFEPVAGGVDADPGAALTVLARVQSVRGRARQEFGKVYRVLAPLYLDLARARSHSDPVLFRMYREPEQQAAMLAQLRTFARCDWTQGGLEREEKVESMVGIFENAVLREFERGIEEGDVDGRMRRYAHVLVALNGGAAGVDFYIQNDPLMARGVAGLGDPLEGLRTAAAGMVNLGPVQAFFRDLARALNEQAGVIDRVFPVTVDALKPFVERVAEDIIAEYITTLFDEAHEQNVEVYLKAVAGVFEQALRFAISLKPTQASPPSFAQDVKAIVARCFEPHFDLYLQEELDYFQRKSDADVAAWKRRIAEEAASTESFYMSNVSRQAAKADFLSSFKKVVMLPVNALSTLPTSFAASKPADTPTSHPSTPVPDRSSTSTPIPVARPQSLAPTTELAAKVAIMTSRLQGISSLFSIELALTLVHAAKASLERLATFVSLGGQSGEEAREQCEAVFVALLQTLGTGHIKAGFDRAVQHLSEYKPREMAHAEDGGVEPLVTFLELVNVGDLIQQMVDVFYAQELVAPRLCDRDDFVSPAAQEKRRFEQMLDERVAAGLNMGIDVLMDEVEYLCATTQKPGDYNPPAGEMVTDLGPSECARRIVKVVEGHTGMLVGSTEKGVLDVFNQEVGVRLFTVLCKHLKRQRVSTEGAIKLISDMNCYHDFIRTFKNKSLLQYFNAMRELSQIYLIDARDAKEIGTIIADSEKYGGIFRAEEVYEFAERRADWFTVKRDVERAMYGMGCAVM